MKTIILIRHAKSSWKNKDLKDAERPLKKRGVEDANTMARVLKEKNAGIQKLISSPAERALTTAKTFAGALGMNPAEIVVDDHLYLESKNKLLMLIHGLDEKINTVAIVSHNPGLTNLANFLTTEEIDNIPTSGIVAISFETDWWNGVDKNKGKMIYFEYPKKYRKKIEKVKSEIL